MDVNHENQNLLFYNFNVNTGSATSIIDDRARTRGSRIRPRMNNNDMCEADQIKNS